MTHTTDVEEIHDTRLAKLRAETSDYLPIQWEGLRMRRYEDWLYLVDEGYREQCRANLRPKPAKPEPPPSDSRVRKLVEVESARHAENVWLKVVSHIEPIHQKLTRFNSVADASAVSAIDILVSELTRRLCDAEARLSVIEGRVAKTEGRHHASLQHRQNLEKKIGKLAKGLPLDEEI